MISSIHGIIEIERPGNEKIKEIEISWAVCVPDLDILSQDVLGFGFLKDKHLIWNVSVFANQKQEKHGKTHWMKATDYCESPGYCT